MPMVARTTIHCGENEYFTEEAVAGLVGQESTVNMMGRTTDHCTVLEAEPIRDEEGRIVGATLLVQLP